jgi:hypothetical protein
MHLGVRKGPMNHFIQVFEQAHTGEIHEEHIGQLERSGAYFARKFADNPMAPVRVRVLRELAGTEPLYCPASAAEARTAPAPEPVPAHPFNKISGATAC